MHRWLFAGKAKHARNNGSFVSYRTQIFSSLFCVLGWTVALLGAPNSEKQNLWKEAPIVKMCAKNMSVGAMSIAGRTFVYNGTHCHATYQEPDLIEVFEAHKTEWAYFGRTQAWWSVLTDDRWKGMTDIPAAYKDEFYQSSSAEYADLSNRLSEYTVSKRDRALDFGSGVGRLTLMLHKRMNFKHVIGVDQSVWHTRIARAEMARFHVQDHVQFLVSGPDLLRTLAGNRFDLVISMIALQHMVPPLMVVYVEQFCDILEVGGFGYFQVPTKLVADYSQFRCSFEWSIQEGGMQVWYLEAAQVHNALERRGCCVLKQYDMDAIGIPESRSELFFFEKMTEPFGNPLKCR